MIGPNRSPGISAAIEAAACAEGDYIDHVSGSTPLSSGAGYTACAIGALVGGRLLRTQRPPPPPPPLSPTVMPERIAALSGKCDDTSFGR
jgi:hypothetical protein